MIDRMLPVQRKRRGATSGRATLDAFATLAETMPPRDQRDFQGRPFPSLTKPKRATPILKYTAASRPISHARYRNHRNGDALICASAKCSRHTSTDCQYRAIRLTFCRLRIAIGRTADSCECEFLKRALTRLKSTAIRITIRPFGLAIQPADFVLLRGVDPWHCHVARQRAGGQQDGYQFARKCLAGLHRWPKMHPVIPQGEPRAYTYETRAISFVSPPTRPPARRQSSPLSSLIELLSRHNMPSGPPHPARWQCSQRFTTLRSYIHDRRWGCV
jgi:hypothetical protein